MLTAERAERWQIAWTYEAGLRELVGLVEQLGPEQLTTRAPACPDWDVADLLRDLELHGTALVTALRRGHDPLGSEAAWGPGAPVTDLSAHVADLREALGLAPDPTRPACSPGSV